jgi:hypothetical protein
MQIAIPEMHKKDGVCYAVTDDGVELPVIDVTHPAFSVEISDDELDRLTQEQVRTLQRQTKLSAFVQSIFMRLMARRSIIMRGLMGAAGGFLTGMNTYILKLGPDNLGNGYASDIDRQISGSWAGLTMRLRLQDIVHLLAEGIIPALTSVRNEELHLLNIGGGPAIDSLNALILIQKEHPELLTGRPIFVHSLDPDEAGPNFGRRALDALQAEGAPLHGLKITFQHTRYDWSHTEVLRELLVSIGGNAIMAASSEGALFEYASDEEVTANLQTMHEIAPPGTIVVGSLTRADATGRLMNSGSRAALRFRGLEAFETLVQQAGWRLTENITRPLCHDFCLKKDQGGDT